MGMKIGNKIGECVKGSWSSEGYLVLVSLPGRDGGLFRAGGVDKNVDCGFSECDKFLGLCGLGFGDRTDMLFKTANEALDATRDFFDNQDVVTIKDLRPRIRKVRFEHSMKWLDEAADFGSPRLKGLRRVCRRCGHAVVRERQLRDYPFYCPNCYENKFSFETELVCDEGKKKGNNHGKK